MNQATKSQTPGTPDASNDHGSGSEEAAAKHPASNRRFLEEETSSSTLENLPPELRSKLLSSIPDLPTLRAVVRASPILHDQYRYDRNTILRACLYRELDGFFVDAYAFVMSRVRELGSPRTSEMITGFLGNYGGWLSGSTPYSDVHTLRSSYVRWLAAYHVSVARPLARRYARWALANLSKAVPSPATQDATTDAVRDHDIVLIRSEEIRIFRAIYRYDTFHHLFGRNNSTRYGSFCHHEVVNDFLCLFKP